MATHREAISRTTSSRRFESCPLRSTSVVRTTTLFPQMAHFKCPVAYPIALPLPGTSEGAALRVRRMVASGRTWFLRLSLHHACWRCSGYELVPVRLAQRHHDTHLF